MEALNIERKFMTQDLWVQILPWRNDPLVYVWSRTGREITLIEHIRWFEERRKRFGSEPIFSYHSSSSFLGTSRLDVGPDTSYEVSLLINPEFRGKGIGRSILIATCAYYFQNLSTASDLKAVIHSDNSTSYNLFFSVGFRKKRVEGNFRVLSLSQATFLRVHSNYI